MKTIVSILALAASFAIMTPSTSEARDHRHHSSRSYSHSCHSCGLSVYRERCITGRDRHGHSVYGWRAVSHSCKGKYKKHHHHAHGHKLGRGFSFFGSKHRH